MTHEAAFSSYLRGIRGFSSYTARNYLHAVRRAASALPMGLLPATRGDIEAHVGALLGSGLAPRTVALELVALKAFY